jgi:hypothetical protein
MEDLRHGGRNSGAHWIHDPRRVRHQQYTGGRVHGASANANGQRQRYVFVAVAHSAHDFYRDSLRRLTPDDGRPGVFDKCAPGRRPTVGQRVAVRIGSSSRQAHGDTSVDGTSMCTVPAGGTLTPQGSRPRCCRTNPWSACDDSEFRSRASRRSNACCRSSSTRSVLTPTVRSTSRSWALYTAPMPPAPRGSVTS